MLIDAHAHLDFEQYENNLDSVIQNSKNNKVELIINNAINYNSSKKTIDIASKNDNIYAAIGLHPHEAKKDCFDDLNKILPFYKNKKVIAVGEIGLDFYYKNQDIKTQKKLFIKQLEYAENLNLPVIIHSRSAEKEAYSIIKKFKIKGALFHCYTGSYDTAKKILDSGFYIGVTGIITFNNRSNADLISKLAPDRLITETDSPYLTPKPFRGKTNSPANIIYIIKMLTTLFKNKSIEYFENSVANNINDLFKIY